MAWLPPAPIAPTSLQAQAAIVAATGRDAACHAWPGRSGQFWCSVYGGDRCTYALFSVRGARVRIDPRTAAPIPCRFGQSGMRAQPGR